jgi:lipoprotein-anchoring transpeptidase ErfK/SrfK
VKKDYYSVLVRAASALDPNSPESRRALYDRARDAMAAAPLTPNEIRQERLALEAAIRKIEAEFADTRDALPPPPAMGRSTNEVSRAPQGTAVLPARRAGALSLFLIPALAAAAMLVAAFFGYQYWRRGGAGRGETTKLAPAPARDVGRTKDAGRQEEKSSSYIFKRQLVFYRTIHPVGTIIISKSQNFLYLTRPNTAALRYTIGIGRECSNVAGLLLVSAKEDWSGPSPPMSAGETPPTVKAIAGQFGARSLALGDTGRRIHGAEEPVVGRAVGCFPLVNDDVIDLYERVALGTKVIMN